MPGNMIDSYLADLDARLLGRKDDIVAEIADGLRDAVEFHRARGLDLESAQRAAIEEMGDPDRLAADFAPEIAARRIRAYGVSFMTTGPLIGAAWIAAALAGSFAAVPLWLTVFGIATFAALAVVVASTGVYTTAAMGRASRWLRLSSRAAARRMLVTASGTMAIDACLLGTAVVVLAVAPNNVAALPLSAGIALSLTRIGIAVSSIRRLAEVRALAA